MPDPPPSNVKIYDRPQRTGLSPILLIVALLILFGLGLFVYRSMHHSVSTAATQGSSIGGQNADTRSGSKMQ